MAWVSDPNSGGVKITPARQRETAERLMAHAKKHYGGTYTKLIIRFRGTFCYIDAERKSEKHPVHLCRLRHYDRDRWSLGFFAYSSEKYELAMFPSGDFFGTPEEGFDVGAVYLEG
jgi:hypothetical protein